MVSSTAQNFSAALKKIVKSMPYGSQTEIADKLGVSRQYLNDLLSGRKRWTDDLKDKASHALGTPVQDLLAIGEILTTVESVMLLGTLVSDIVAPFGSYCTGFFRYASSRIISRLSSAFMVM